MPHVVKKTKNMKSSNSCQFCKKNEPLVKSHIIPKALYWGLDQSTVTESIVNKGKIIKAKGEKHKSPVVISTVLGEFQKRRPEGIYGQFLCHTCEARFNEWDNYAVAVLRDTQPQDLLQKWKYENFDYVKLKLFFMSLLWRAAVTEERFFEDVVLSARDLSRIKLLIKKSRPGSWTEYSVLLWRSEEIIANAIFSPEREEYEGLSFIRMYLPGYLAFIKVDHRALPVHLKSWVLNESQSWLVSKIDYSASGDWARMLDTARKSKK